MKTKCMSCGGATKKMKTGGAAKPKLTTPKMKLGGTLPKAKDGLSCYHRAERTNKRRKYWHEGGGKTIKNIGKNILGAGALVGAGAVAYKKSTPFKNAVDELKGKLGFNKTGGAVKKYQDGGATDSLKIVKKEGKLAVKTEKQKQAAAKKATAYAKKIAKAKENAKLNLEWEKMSESQKDSVIRQQRSRF